METQNRTANSLRDNSRFIQRSIIVTPFTPATLQTIYKIYVSYYISKRQIKLRTSRLWLSRSLNIGTCKSTIKISSFSLSLSLSLSLIVSIDALPAIVLFTIKYNIIVVSFSRLLRSSARPTTLWLSRGLHSKSYRLRELMTLLSSYLASQAVISFLEFAPILGYVYQLSCR